MRIRPAISSDSPAVQGLVFTVLAEYGLKGDPEGTDSDLKDIEESYLKPGGMFEVIETNEGRVVGSVGVYPKGDGVGELRKMYLLKEARGQGWGKRLLEDALDFARSRGFRCLELETASCLIEAVALYRRYGFREIKTDHLASRCDQAFALDLDNPALSSE
jgi:putative acetyltransferase